VLFQISWLFVPCRAHHSQFLPFFCRFCPEKRVCFGCIWYRTCCFMRKINPINVANCALLNLAFDCDNMRLILITHSNAAHCWDIIEHCHQIKGSNNVCILSHHWDESSVSNPCFPEPVTRVFWLFLTTRNPFFWLFLTTRHPFFSLLNPGI